MAGLLAAILCLFSGLSVQGQHIARWTNPAGGRWHVASNWENGVLPGGTTIAEIALDGTYTVTVDQPVTVAGLILRGESGNQSLTVGANVTVRGTVAIGPAATVKIGQATLDAADIANRGVLEVGPTQFVSATSTLRITAGLLSNEASARIVSVAGPGMRAIHLEEGSVLDNRGRVEVPYPLVIDMKDAVAHLWHLGSIEVDAGQTLTLRGGRLTATGASLTGHVIIENVNLGEGVIPAGARLELRSGSSSGARIVNRGVIEVNGVYRFGGRLVNDGTGTVRIGQAELTVAGGMENRGVIELGPCWAVWGWARLQMSGGTLRNEASGRIVPVTGPGSRAVELAGAAGWENRGRIEVGHPLQVTMQAPSIFESSGYISVNEGLSLTVQGGRFSIDRGGILEGRGTVNVTQSTFVNNGTLRPGPGFGRLTVQGNMALGATSELEFDIGGTAPGVDMDQLAVSGEITLGGRLRGALAGGLVPEPDDRFHVLTFGTYRNAFTAADLPVLAGEPLRLVYESKGVAVSRVGEAFNNPPHAVNDLVTANPETPLQIDVLYNDVDPDGDPLVITAVTLPRLGQTVITDDGRAVLYTPNPGVQSALDWFDYTISDGRGGTGQARAEVQIRDAVNLSPFFSSAPPVEAVPYRPYRYVVRAQDPDGDPLTYVLAEGPTWLRLDGTVLSGTPGTLDAGVSAVSIEVSDGQDNTARQRFSLRVLEAAALPDLIVAEIQVADAVNAGQTISLEWVVKNVGESATNVPAWTDYVWLSTDDDLRNAEDMLLGRFENLTYLEPGQSYRQQRQVTLPSHVIGSQYLFVSTDNDDAVDLPSGRYSHSKGTVAESNESNNFAYRIIQIKVDSPPDLQIASFTAPAEVFSGSSVNVRLEVANRGAGPTLTDRWTDAVYLSEDALLDPMTDIRLRSFRREGTLARAGTYVVADNVALPQDRFGDYFLIAVTDVDDQVYEHVMEMNNRAVIPISITLTPPPDLVATDVQVPASANSGETVEVRWTVRNEGPGPTAAKQWTDRVYLSDSEVFDPSTVLPLAAYMRNGALPVDGGYDASVRVTLPNGISGVRHVFVMADADSLVFEHLYGDNNVERAPTTLNVTLAPWADLVPGPVEVAGTLQAGSRIRVSWSARNTGAAAATGSWTDRIFLSHTQQLNESAIVLAATPRQGPLSPGVAYEAAIDVTLPVGAEGTYHVVVQLDAGDAVFEHTGENNNMAATAALSIAPYPRVDLRLASLSVPAAGSSGAPLAVEFVVENAGEAATVAGSWFDRLYLSGDRELQAGTDHLLETIQRREPLASGASYRRAQEVRLPDGIAGTYYMIAVADVARATRDADRANNVFVSSPIAVTRSPSPDLQVSELTVPPTGRTGQPVTIRWSVVNAGRGATQQSAWYDALYLSTDQAIDRADSRLGVFAHAGALSAGASYEAEARVELPEVPTGDYYVLVSLDSRNDLYEHEGEHNNLAAASIHIEQPPPADLVVTGVSAPASATVGDPVTLSWTVENRGAHPARGWIRDAIYLSADAVWDLDDPLVGLSEREIDLAANAMEVVVMKSGLTSFYRASPEGEITEELPGVVPGDYYVIVRTNVRGTIRESDSRNNTAASPGPVAVDMPVLTAGSTIEATLAERDRRFWRIPVPGNETLQIALAGNHSAAFNGLFVRRGAPPSPARFDLSHRDPFRANQEVVVPRTVEGDYYVLVEAIHVPTEAETISLRADLLEFEIRRMDVSAGGSGGRVTTKIEGAKFTRHLEAYLRQGPIEHRAPMVYLEDASTLYATFDLAEAAPGMYDVVLRDTLSGTEARRADGFQVSSGGVSPLQLNLRLPQEVRAGREFELSLEYYNPASVDVDAPLVLITTAHDVVLDLPDPTRLAPGVYLVRLRAEEGPRYIIRPGAVGTHVISGRAPESIGDTPVRIAQMASPATEWSTIELIIVLSMKVSTPELVVDLVPDLIRDVLAYPGERVVFPGGARFVSASRFGGSVVDHQKDLRILGNTLVQPGIIIGESDAFFAVVVASDLARQRETMGHSDALNVDVTRFLPEDAPPGSLAVIEYVVMQYTMADAAVAERGLAPLQTALHRARRGFATVAGLEGERPIAFRQPALITSGSRLFSGFIGFVEKILGDKPKPSSSGRMCDHESLQVTETGYSIWCDGSRMDVDIPDHVWIPLRNEVIKSIGSPGKRSLMMLQDEFAVPISSLEQMDANRYSGSADTAEKELAALGGANVPGPCPARSPQPESPVCLQLKGGAEICGDELREMYTICTTPALGSPDSPFCEPLKEAEAFLRTVGAIDPNDITGPAGAGDEHWVATTSELDYLIRFENDPSLATAPAQVVTISHPLDPNVDPRSFRLGSFGFGSYTFDVPESRSFYAARLDVSERYGVNVDVTAGIDVQAGRAFWSFRSVDPFTGGEPSNPLSGFLPVNDDEGAGEGFARYRIRPVAGAGTGSAVAAVARIVFDANDPLDTPVYVNTLDADPPVSRAEASPTAAGSEIIVRWSGSDAGSGISRVFLYAADGDGPFQLAGSIGTDSSFVFPGETGSTYHFFTIATDRAGNTEPMKSQAEAVVVVGVEEDEVPAAFALYPNYPNPFNPTTTIPFDVPVPADVELILYDLLGRRVAMLVSESFAPGHYRLEADLSPYASGVYFYEIRARDAGEIRFREVRKCVLVK
jgi:subtilase family serine protease